MRWPWSKKSEEFLTPGQCECGHTRNCHVDGEGPCRVGFPIDTEKTRWSQCACQIYIPKHDNNDGDNASDYLSSEEVKELENLYKLKGPKK